MSANTLTKQQLTEFKLNEFVVIKDFYNLATQLLTIQKAAHQLIGKVMERYDSTEYYPPVAPKDFRMNLTFF